MLAGTLSTHLNKSVVCDEHTWYDLFCWLLPIVEVWVWEAGVISWRGQQREISEDIVLETIARAFRYSQRADQGEMPPIGSLKALCRVIACNYFRDWRKKDWCLVHIVEDGANDQPSSVASEVVDASQIALDHLLLDSVIVSVAQVLAKFPHGQREALLTDLANISDFDEPPSLLEQALAQVGLQLSDYQRPRSDDRSARGRHAALLSIAYKRLRHEIQM